VSDPSHELASLRSLCKDAELWEEGGNSLVYLPALKIQVAGVGTQVDALLCPRKYDGYDTRLFLAKPFPVKGQNWKAFTICGRTWHAFSYQGVSASLPWLEILANHLQVLK